MRHLLAQQVERERKTAELEKLLEEQAAAATAREMWSPTRDRFKLIGRATGPRCARKAGRSGPRPEPVRVSMGTSTGKRPNYDNHTAGAAVFCELFFVIV